MASGHIEVTVVTHDVVNKSVAAVREIMDSAIMELLHQVQRTDGERLSFEAIRIANVSRCERWHGLKDWSPLEWAGAMCGEAGEAANVAKKLKRIDGDVRSANNPATREIALQKLSEEIGGTFMYLDLLAARCGLSVAQCIRTEFNRISEREGFPERL